jgi:hypothetical protein
MKAIPTLNVLCPVIGHNFEITSSKVSIQDRRFSCKTCNVETSSYMEFPFSEGVFKNREITLLLRQLFMLKVSYAQIK